jgi:aminoglycoside phosphotransferase (APT) family kinase protein
MPSEADNQPSVIESVVALHGWETTAEPSREGNAERVSVTLPDGQPALLYAWADEAGARRAAKVHEVVGAEIFAVPDCIDHGPRWVLVEHPEGAPAPDALGVTSVEQLDLPRAREVASEVGEVLRKVHTVPSEKYCGDVLGDEPLSAGKFLTFSGYVAHQLERFAENLRVQSFSEPEMERLQKSIADLRHELSAFHPRNPSGYCHGRPALEHVWLDQTGRSVVGLTGFDYAALLPREADLAYILWIGNFGRREAVARAFYDGYGAARTMDVQRRERFYRRLVAFQALFGQKGDVGVDAARLIELTTASADP